MEQLNGLDPENGVAWDLYRRCCNRFVTDIQAGSVLLDRLTDHLDADDFADQMERLLVIYDTLQPPKSS